MNKNTGFLALVILLVAIALPAHAQKTQTVPVIGFLGNSSLSQDAKRIEAFRQGLRDLGWLEGKNFRIEYRYANGTLERLPSLATALVGMKVDVIVARGSRATRAAQNATKSIPIVMLAAADPVRTGLVASLARPSGNITGMSTILPELSGKRLELLREVLPKLVSVGFLAIRGVGQSTPLFVKESVSAGQVLGLQVHPLLVNGPEEFEEVFSNLKIERTSALMIQPFLVGGLGLGPQIASLAKKHHLPTISDFTRFVEEGGLLSYGPDVLDMTRRGAFVVDKILKGSKPADIPVEQPTKFELGINLVTAKQIGLTIPQWTLMKADRVIK